ncbi:MAG TPA: class I SAM-dependent methyltransferase, partial [Labilithrix sp.]|nr:class I SAM-dependent methyltransferase [Labilithrix sp.]
YREHRRRAIDALQVKRGSLVLDLPCGTGQSFTALATALGGTGRVVGVDLSAGMLREARRRVERAMPNVSLLKKSADEITTEDVGGAPDRLLIFLGMTVFSDHEAVFAHLWSLLAPGGRCVIVDVHAEDPEFQGKMVQWIARANLRRRFWEPLERVGVGFAREDLPFDRRHGGQIMMASADKPM